MTGALARLPGRLVADRYEIDNVVSAGASTIITEAIDTELDRPVTVKIVRPELVISRSFRTAFAKQVAVATSLAHPNIAATLDSGELDIDGESALFWVVEYLGGGSLRDIFDRGRLLEPSQALVVGLEACRALDAAHARGVVHTEVTPSKLVFGTDGRLRIIDFAMAELMGAEAWTDPATVPTHVARYASPEQALALEVDAKTDIYALSLCLIEAVTGRVPFAGDSTVSTLAARVGKLMPVTADMGSLAAVLERGGRPDPEDRWTASEFAQALVHAAEALPRPEPVPVLSASLFASTLAARQGAAAPTIAPTPDAPNPDAAHPETPDELVGIDADGLASNGADEVAANGAPEQLDPPPPAAVADLDHETAEDGNAAVGTAEVDDTAITDDDIIDDVVTDGSDVENTGVDSAVTDGSTADPSVDPTTALAADPAVDGPTSPDGPDGLSTAEMPASVAAAAAVATAPPTTEMGALETTPPGVIYDEERAKRPRAKYIVLGIVVVAGLVALGYAGWLLLRTKSYEVPDLVGIDEAVALNEISGNGWEIETERERSDEVPEVDHVVRTVPPAGERLNEGETFVLYISNGPEFRTLPELEGLPIDEATTTLEELRLVPVETDREYSETVPADTVIRWHVQGDASSGAGARVLPETVIEITVSRGPQPRPAPDLTNMTPEEATAALEELQLVYEAAEDVFSSDVEAGRVATQTPAPTTPVERGGTVTVQVSKGPELVAIPDLAGLSYPDAREALEEAGYAVNELTGTTEGTFVSISVDGTEVSAGDTFPRGTAVDLIFL